MDERSDPRTPPSLEPVQAPGFDGGAFRRIPVLPVVALVTLFLGILIGYGLAPKPPVEPTASPALSAAAASSTPTASGTASAAASPTAAGGSSEELSTPTPFPTPSPPSEDAAATAPSGGITIAQAIATAKSRFRLKDSQILGVVLVDDRGVYSDKPPNRWTWEVLVAGNVGPCSSSSGQVSPAPSDMCFGSFSVVRVDYYTGQILP